MAFNRSCLLTVMVCILVYVPTQAQTVYYPAGASQLLQSTAEDVAMLLQKSVAGSRITAQPYVTEPATGIVLVYDEMGLPNQACRAKSNGNNKISFRAKEDNGLCYGLYEYLYQLGFRFYQPGDLWEIIPALSTPYIIVDSVYSCRFKYKNWFISGGHTTWVMDKDYSFYWETYQGALGHNWSLYQRRNNMVGAYRFAGHRDEILTNTYLNVLQNNPCYVASYNGSREATRQSVPDVHTEAAMQLWASSIENQFTTYRNNIFSHPDVYKNYVRNFSFANSAIGIEVPDGSRWANTIDNSCGNSTLLKPSDQHFILANYTAAHINRTYPNGRFQLYAYDSHADVPSNTIAIDKNIDVQVVPDVYQSETSAKALMKRWYSRTGNLSEYHYFNLPQWSGETPASFLHDLETTVNRIQEQNAQGVVWEASAAKFASLPFLLSANRTLINGGSIQHHLRQFCNQLFGSAAGTVFTLMQYWGSTQTVVVSNGIQDNKYKLPFYFELVKRAADEVRNDPPVVRRRISELKAYLHYMVLYYDWVFDQRSVAAKAAKAEALCFYLAQISRLQIVNSYFLISDVVRKYADNSEVYTKFNIASGIAYQNGQLPSITDAQVEVMFDADYIAQRSMIDRYVLKDATEIKQLFEANHLLPLEKIDVTLRYTYGKDYAAGGEFYFIAERAGNITIQYTPGFEIPGRGYINFAVEDVNRALGVISDYSVAAGSKNGTLQIAVPAAGTYKLTVTSKYKSNVALTIVTNGNYFYKNGPFLGNTVENYRGNLLSLPGYFYVPEGIGRVYFSLNNSNPAGRGFATPADISRAFAFRNKNGKTVEPVLASPADSALFYLDVPAGEGGFWQAFKMEQYRLCFANTSNIQWYARRKPCSNATFTTLVKSLADGCVTQLTTTAPAGNIKWEVYDAQLWTVYKDEKTILLPVTATPNTIVTLTTAEGCSSTRRIGDDMMYLQQKTSCATGAAVPADPSTKVVVYPNPGTGLFRCMQNGIPAVAEEVQVSNASGARVAGFVHTQEFNISSLPAGVYFYSISINRVMYKGKLVKM